jgi:alpha-ketoglutaric semialdehyde dehydrogenase
MTVEVRNLVAGEWVGSPEVDRSNPARPHEVASRTALASAAEVETAIEAAVAAQREWARTSGPARGQVLTRAAELLEQRTAQIALDITEEEGKTLAEATGEVTRSASILRFFGSLGWAPTGSVLPVSAADDLVYTRREPVGVVAAITPWNFPLAIPTWKTAPALIAGNAVLLKPALIAPTAAWHLASALTDAGLPAGVLALLNGPGSVVGDQLAGDRRVGALTFTGSVAVGSGLYARVAPRRTRVQLEMGGKNATVVLDDADPAAAAQIVAAGAFGLTGQACTATSRLICTPGIRTALVEAMAEQARRYRAGDGTEPGTLMGPVVSDAQLATDREFIDIARAEGGTVVTGESKPDGLLHDPVIVTGVDPGSRLAQEEVFGPVLAVIEVPDLSAALQVLNGTNFGLSAGIITNDLAASARFCREAEAGIVKVNRPTTGAEPNVPFGGVKDSSTNTYREQGHAATEFFTWTKSVYAGDPPWAG